jgi:hypothetical protein
VVVVLVDIPIKTLSESSLVNPTRHLDVAPYSTTQRCSMSFHQ